MRIQHNIPAMSSYRNYTNNTSALAKNLEKLSSGYKINRAGDDAAGLAISEKMRAQITGLEVAQKNAKDGISLVQTAEGALTEVHDMLNRMYALAEQSANGTYDNEVDRLQLQKEVDSLRTEINRIADSSNFNGIKLLDGSLGLNQNAFSFESVGAVKASDGSVDVGTLMAPDGTAYSDLHLEVVEGNAGNPEFVIDLNSLTVEKVGTSVTGDKITFTINGKTIESAGKETTNEIATELAKELRKSEMGITLKDGSSNVGGSTTEGTSGVRIGDAAFKVVADEGKLTFTYEGRWNAEGEYKKETTFNGTAEEAAAINKALGFKVDVTGITSEKGNTLKGDIIHDTTGVKEANAAAKPGLAGVDLTLTADVVRNNSILTIDGKKFQFKTSEDGFEADDEATEIDVSSAKTDEERIHMAVDLLSQQAEFDGEEERTWKIGVKNSNTIHVDQTTATEGTTATPGTGGGDPTPPTDPDAAINTYDKLKELFSVTGDPIAAANAGTKITVNSAKVEEGNVLTIDGKKYVFTTDADKQDTGDITYVQFTKGGKDAVSNLAAKLGVSGSDLDVNAGTVIVRAANSDSPAPVAAGKGLTLQIGDTAEEFNQLNVSVKDMHADAMGIGDIDIGTQDGAAAAVQKIKDAINYVSDVRGTLGATQNRLDHTINNLSVMQQNIQDAESTIRDVDIAEEMMDYTKNSILVQSAQAMLAQANQMPQGVLQLLQ